MSKTILLARPHPFIVSAMKPFLEKNGYSINKMESLSEMPSKAIHICGAIISLAISSPVSESAEVVFKELRKTAPRAPVVFAAMPEFSKMRREVERIAESAGIEALPLGVELSSERHPALGKSGTLLYISKADFDSPERLALAGRILQRHMVCHSV